MDLYHDRQGRGILASRFSTICADVRCGPVLHQNNRHWSDILFVVCPILYHLLMCKSGQAAIPPQLLELLGSVSPVALPDCNARHLEFDGGLHKLIVRIFQEAIKN